MGAKERRRYRAEVRKHAVPVAIDPRGGTPGREIVDATSRPAKAGALAARLVAMHPGTTETQAIRFLEQAESDIGEFIKHGYDPETVAHLLVFELALAAHHTQTPWDKVRSFVAQHLGPYYDVLGPFMEREAETDEARDATEGVAVPVDPATNVH